MIGFAADAALRYCHAVEKLLSAWKYVRNAAGTETLTVEGVAAAGS